MLSREAAVRRYVALHRARLAVVFSLDGRFTYVDPAPGFPFLALRWGDPMPDLPEARNGAPISAMETADPDDWLAGPRRTQLYVQTLVQQNGYRTTLLAAETGRVDDEGDDAEDLVEGIGRLR